MVKLQGTAPNQVPTNADLGSLAYADHDNVNLTAADLKLKALSKTKSQTAVDVFVYDTSKDTDGGAWRHRTQHTSWYNESASSTRGSRKEFPAVAVIVAEEHTITIYDGDDPSLPMWMIFPENAGALGGVTSADKDLTSVAMLNGVLVGGYGNGLSYVNFLSEVLERGFNVSTSNVGVLPFNVSERDQNPAGLGGTLNLEIVNANVNDVAMTVLPDAPTDPATGLPVPTIAVATNGGVSVITDSGAVYDSSWSSDIGLVDFTSDNDLWYFRSSGSAHRAFLATLEDYSAGDGFGDQLADDRAGLEEFDLLTRSQKSAVFLDSFAIGGFSSATASTVPGLMLHQPNYVDQTKGMSALTTSSYATGWMPGDIKLAALADTTAETLSGTPLLDDDFASGTTGWTFEGTATDTSTAGFLSGTTGGASNLLAHQTITTEAGKTYTLEVTTGPVSSAIYVGAGAPGGINLGSSGFGTNATLSTTFVATGTTTYISAMSVGGSANVSIDNISVRLADPDRSVNGNGLAVYGSITKELVATGADVVGYSGFSASNYLEQPYNGDLNFGAGDFSVMGWLKTTNASDIILDSRDATAQDGFVVTVNSSGYTNFATYEGGSTSALAGTTVMNDNTWRFFTAVRSNSGTSLDVYVNGLLDNSSTVTARDISSTARYTRVGVSFTETSAFNAGSLALLRISGTAPTADQIAKIYEDEKVLFQPNAKATLTGSSDAVTALAYDPDTNLLHVGTSGGRSVFQGLRRVDETATAVTTAISAVDDLVVEQ